MEDIAAAPIQLGKSEELSKPVYTTSKSWNIQATRASALESVYFDNYGNLRDVLIEEEEEEGECKFLAG